MEAELATSTPTSTRQQHPGPFDDTDMTLMRALPNHMISLTHFLQSLGLDDSIPTHGLPPYLHFATKTLRHFGQFVSKFERFAGDVSLLGFQNDNPVAEDGQSYDIEVLREYIYDLEYFMEAFTKFERGIRRILYDLNTSYQMTVYEEAWWEDIQRRYGDSVLIPEQLKRRFGFLS